MRKIFLDCGSHYGEGLIEFNNSHHIGHGWEIYSFEPNPFTNTQDALKDIIKDWTSSIQFIKKAIHTHTGKVNFFCSKRDNGELGTWWSDKFPEIYKVDCTKNNDLSDGVGSHIDGVRNKDYGGQMQEIEAISLRDFIDTLDLKPEDEVTIKMDIEGSEFQVIPDLLEYEKLSNIKEIFCEVHNFTSNNIDLKSLCDNRGLKFQHWY